MASSRDSLPPGKNTSEDPNFDMGKAPNSRGYRKIFDNTYKPGFIDKSNPEIMKMSIDRELGEISKALFKTGERETDLSDESEKTKEIVEELKVEVGNGSASVTELKKVVASNTKAIAETETKLTATINDVNSQITTTNKVVADLEKSTASQITQLDTKYGTETASIKQELSSISSSVGGLETKWAITTDVNGKIAGVELMNGSKGSEFNILADKFNVYNGTTDEQIFTIENGKTHIRNAIVGDIWSDDWNNADKGWAIWKDGRATFNSVKVRGEVNATSGVFSNVTISENCTINATAKIGTAQVDTLQIAGNAVTIPSFDEKYLVPHVGVGQVDGDVDVKCEVLDVVYNSPANVIFLASGLSQGSENTNFGVLMEIYKDGTLYTQKRFSTTSLGGLSSVHTFMTNFNLDAAGTYSFKTKVFNSWGSGWFLLKNLSMSIIGAKR